MSKLHYYSNPSFTRQLLSDTKTRWARKLGSKKKLPWMYQKEIDLLTEVLLNLKPENCLEWGSGFSTVYFPPLLGDAKWTSIEHNEEWYHIISKENTNPNVEVVLVKPDNEPYTDPKKDGSYDDFKSYIEKPQGTFDFIFIDGRARKDCVKKAHELISDRGVVVLHDANRTHYYDYLDMFPNRILMDDFHKKYGGVWLGSKNSKLEELADMPKHQTAWEKHDRFAKITRPFS